MTSLTSFPAVRFGGKDKPTNPELEKFKPGQQVVVSMQVDTLDRSDFGAEVKTIESITGYGDMFDTGKNKRLEDEDILDIVNFTDGTMMPVGKFVVEDTAENNRRTVVDFSAYAIDGQPLIYPEDNKEQIQFFSQIPVRREILSVEEYVQMATERANDLSTELADEKASGRAARLFNGDLLGILTGLLGKDADDGKAARKAGGAPAGHVGPDSELDTPVDIGEADAERAEEILQEMRDADPIRRSDDDALPGFTIAGEDDAADEGEYGGPIVDGPPTP